MTSGFLQGHSCRNPPANTGDMSLIPGPGGPGLRRPWSNQAQVPRLLSPLGTTTEAQALKLKLLEPMCPGAAPHNFWGCYAATESWVPRAFAPHQEKPPQREAGTPKGRVADAHHNKRKPADGREDPLQPKINKINKYIKIK